MAQLSSDGNLDTATAVARDQCATWEYSVPVWCREYGQLMLVNKRKQVPRVRTRSHDIRSKHIAVDRSGEVVAGSGNQNIS